MNEVRERQTSGRGGQEKLEALGSASKGVVTVIDKGVFDQRYGGLLGFSARSSKKPMAADDQCPTPSPADLSCVPDYLCQCPPSPNDLSCAPGSQCACTQPDTQCTCPPPDSECTCPPVSQCDCPPPDSECGCSAPDSACGGGGDDGDDGGDGEG